MSTYLLDARLAAVAGLVREGAVVADIGCDHGHLCCHLVDSRKCPRAFACDINEAPLARARSNILSLGLGNRILALRTDGLRDVPVDGPADIVIAGMGGDLIARILLEWEGCKDGAKRFILQPMTKPEHLRAALYREGFIILDEAAVIAGDFVYGIMVVQYTGSCVEVSEFFAWTGKLWEKPLEPPVLQYFSGVHKVLCQKAEGYAESGKHPALAMEYAQLAERVCRRLEEGS